MPSISVSAIAAFSDNYIWLIRTEGNACAVVDPGDAAPVIKRLEKDGLDLRYILLTHHHWDHSGGIKELKSISQAKVFGPDDSRLSGIDFPMKEGDTAELADLGLQFDVLEVPGHTSSHIVFWGHGALYCGDTLFSAGCGRLFEGTAQQMQDSLDKLAQLPPETSVYCGHEYTLSNCQFALEVEPDNPDLHQMLGRVKAQRANEECSLPGTMREELLVNPFLRSRENSVVSAARKRQPSALPGAQTLGIIRQWKDSW